MLVPVTKLRTAKQILEEHLVLVNLDRVEAALPVAFGDLEATRLILPEGGSMDVRESLEQILDLQSQNNGR